MSALNMRNGRHNRVAVIRSLTTNNHDRRLRVHAMVRWLSAKADDFAATRGTVIASLRIVRAIAPKSFYPLKLAFPLVCTHAEFDSLRF
jgi:hypothetical protein